VDVIEGLRAHEMLRAIACACSSSLSRSLSLARKEAAPLGMGGVLPSMTLGETTFLRRRLQTRVGGAA